jgi:hypothetical protein
MEHVMSDPTFNSVKIQQNTAGAVVDLLALDAVDASAGTGAALSFLNNSAVDPLHFTLGRISARRVDATSVQLDLAVANDPTASSSDDTAPALSLRRDATSLRVTTPPSSVLALGGALEVAGTTTLQSDLQVSGNITVTGTVDGRDLAADGAQLDLHHARTDNPHATTAAQVGALALAGGAITGGLSVAGNLSIRTASTALPLTIGGDFGRDDGPSTIHLWGSRIGDSGGGTLFLRSGGGTVAFDGNDNVGIGLSAPRNQLHVLGRIATGLDFSSAGAITFYPPDGFAWFHIDNGPAGGRPMGRLRISHGGSPGTFELMNILQNGRIGVGTAAPARRFQVHSDDWNQSSEILASGSTAGLSFTNRDTGRLFDNGGAGERWVWYSEGHLARLWTSGSGDVMSITTGGRISSRVKSFVIEHPNRPGYNLVHACLEGPENAVFYRGEACLHDGRAVVELPAYFEALTMRSGRTVQLTAQGSEPFLLSYTKIVDGTFIVHGSHPEGKFTWEVKAIRADIDSLEVEVERV